MFACTPIATPIVRGSMLSCIAGSPYLDPM